MSIDIENLKMLAVAATPGPWRECGHDRGGCSCALIWATESDQLVAEAWKGDDMVPAAAVAPTINAAYIAAANPAAVLELVAEVERLRAYVSTPTAEGERQSIYHDAEFRRLLRACGETWDTYEWDAHATDLAKFLDAFAARSAGDAVPASTMHPMCERKTNHIMERDGYEKTGYVLKAEGRRICVSDAGAVAWFTPEQWSWLMFNRDHIEFEWPKPVGQLAASPAPGNTESAAPADPLDAPLYSTRQDAARFRKAIAAEDNAEALYAAVMNNAPDAAAIRREFDAAPSAAPVVQPEKATHPVQPLVIAEHGRIRFKRNRIVEHLAEGKLNDLACMDFPQEDWEQLAQLIGYSLDGFGTLSYVTDDTYNRAAEQEPIEQDERDSANKGAKGEQP